MSSKTITFKLIRDFTFIEYVFTRPLFPNGTFVFEIPRDDLRKWKHAGGEITIEDVKEDQ